MIEAPEDGDLSEGGDGEVSSFFHFQFFDGIDTIGG